MGAFGCVGVFPVVTPSVPSSDPSDDGGVGTRGRDHRVRVLLHSASNDAVRYREPGHRVGGVQRFDGLEHHRPHEPKHFADAEGDVRPGRRGRVGRPNRRRDGRRCRPPGGSGLLSGSAFGTVHPPVGKGSGRHLASGHPVAALFTVVTAAGATSGLPGRDDRRTVHQSDVVPFAPGGPYWGCRSAGGCPGSTGWHPVRAGRRGIEPGCVAESEPGPIFVSVVRLRTEISRRNSARPAVRFPRGDRCGGRRRSGGPASIGDAFPDRRRVSQLSDRIAADRCPRRISAGKPFRDEAGRAFEKRLRVGRRDRTTPFNVTRLSIHTRPSRTAAGWDGPGGTLLDDEPPGALSVLRFVARVGIADASDSHADRRGLCHRRVQRVGRPLRGQGVPCPRLGGGVDPRRSNAGFC